VSENSLFPTSLCTPSPVPPPIRCIVSANCRLRSRAATSEEPKHTAPDQNVLCPMQMLTPRPAFLHWSKSNLIVFHLQVYQHNITNINGYTNNVANVQKKFHVVLFTFKGAGKCDSINFSACKNPFILHFVYD